MDSEKKVYPLLHKYYQNVIALNLKSYLKCGALLLNRPSAIQYIWGLSKLLACLPRALIFIRKVKQFFETSNFDFWQFWSLLSHKNANYLYESPLKYWIVQELVKSIVALLRYEFLIQSDNTNNTCIIIGVSFLAGFMDIQIQNSKKSTSNQEFMYIIDFWLEVDFLLIWIWISLDLEVNLY